MKINISGSFNIDVEILSEIPTPTPRVSTEGLLAYWKLDEAESVSRSDSGPGRHTLEASGNLLGVSGKIGNGAELGLNNSLLNAEPGIWGGTPPFTAFAWVRVDSDIANGKQIFGHFNPAGLGSGWSVRLQNIDRKFAFRLANGAGQLLDLTHPVVISPGAFNLVVVTLDENLVASIRVNDSPEILAPGLLPSNPAIPFRVGTDQLGINRLVGVVDELGIFNRVLTQEEKDALWNGGAGLSHPFLS